MNLHNVYPVPSQFNWTGTNGHTTTRPVLLKGIWLGSTGREDGFLHNFVPVMVGMHEPGEDQWGIVPSVKGKPKIVANSDPREGFIAVLSAYGGEGRIVGNVLVAHSDLDQVRVIAHGVGGNAERTHLLRYWEYLVEIAGPAEFLIEPTATQRYLLRFEPGKEVKREAVTQETMETQQFVLLTEPSVKRWRNPNGESQSRRTHDDDLLPMGDGRP